MDSQTLTLSSKRVAALYKHLNQLTQQYQKDKLSQGLLAETFTFSEQLLQAVSSLPELWVGLLVLPNKVAPHVLHQSMLRCIWVALLGYRNRINLTTLQQLICAAIALPVSVTKDQQAGSGARPSLNKKLLKALKAAHQDIWFDGYVSAFATSVNKTSKPKITAHSRSNAILTLAIKLSMQSGQIPYKLALLRSQLNQAELEYAKPLSQYPGFVSPGTRLLDDKKQDWLVIAITDGALVGLPIDSLADRHASAAFNQIPLTKVRSIKASPPLKALKLLDLLWGEAWLAHREDIGPLSQMTQSSFKIDRPAASLMRIQTQLHQPQVDLEKVSAMIVEEPHFSAHLLESASQASRMKLAISDVKHSLLLNGFERSNQILIRQALMQRMNQHHFPLQQALVQFTQLRAQILAILAEQCLGSVYTEEAKTLALFASTGLFTSLKLKSRNHFLNTSPSRIFDIDALVAFNEKTTLNEKAIMLAQSWQQPREYIHALRLHNKLPKHMQADSTIIKWACMLGLSLIVSRSVFSAQYDMCEESTLYLQQALARLKLNIEDYSEIAEQAVAACRPYSPLY